MMQRKILSFLDRHPFFDALFEIVSIVVFSLMPILIAAFQSMTHEPELKFEKYTTAMSGFISHGEFVILTIGLCGSIFWLAMVKLQNTDGFQKFLFVFLPVVGLAFPVCISLLGQIKNSEGPIPTWLVWLTFIIYVGCLIVYLWALYREKG